MEYDVNQASLEAQACVASMLHEHRAAGIPALVAACVLWAVENGGADLVRGTLQNAISMSHELEAAHRKTQS